MLKHIVTAIILLALSTSFSECTSIRRYYFNGILYEDYTPASKNVQYIRTADKDWKSLSSLVRKSKMMFKSVFCTIGNGAWIVYPEKNFNYGTSMTFQLVIGEDCVTAEDVESVQPLGAMNQKLTSGLFTFTSPYFSSAAKVVKSGSTSGGIKSLFQIGNHNWTIEGTGPNGMVKYCMKRAFTDDGTSLCSLTDIEVQLGIKGSLNINEGCDTEDKTFNLQTCYTRGSYKITVEKDITLSNVKALCKTGMNSTEQILLNKFTQIMEIWNARIREKIGDRNSMMKGDSDDADIKTTMLWKVISIFERGCPSVTSGYLSILGTIFYNHLNKAWTSDPDLKVLTGDSWAQANNYLLACSNNLMHTGGVDGHRQMEEKIHPPVPEPGYVFQDIDEGDRISLSPTGRRVKRQLHSGSVCRTDTLGAIQPGPQSDAIQYMIGGHKFDAVIEQIWLIFNFVHPYCSYVNNYSDNFWSYFVSILRNTFLLPLQEQWIKPDMWTQIYPSMFNGFEMEIEKTNIISCIQSVMTRTAKFDPISRPNIFKTNSTLKVSSPGKANETDTSTLSSDGTRTNEKPTKGRAAGRSMTFTRRGRGRKRGYGRKGKKHHLRRRKKKFKNRDHSETMGRNTAQVSNNSTQVNGTEVTSEVVTSHDTPEAEGTTIPTPAGEVTESGMSDVEVTTNATPEFPETTTATGR